MVKLMLGLAVVAFCGFLGYFLSKKYRRRKEFFLQWAQFNDRFLTEISYYKRPIVKFMVAYPYKGEFAVLLDYVRQSLEADGEGGRRNLLVEKEDLPFLTLDELSFIGDYFQMLGRGDTHSQKAYFNAMKAQLNAWKEKSVEEGKKYGDLYLKLGILVGIAILIIIV